MTQCIRTAYGYKLIFSERMLDLQTPRLIRVSYLETDQRKSRLVRGVSKVVKDDGDLYAFYRGDGTLIERIGCVYGDELEALVPGFGGGTRVL
jgi:hypothetical protein